MTNMSKSEIVTCCNNCRCLISHAKGNKYGDVEHLCYAKGLFIITKNLSVDRSKDSKCKFTSKESKEKSEVKELDYLSKVHQELKDLIRVNINEVCSNYVQIGWYLNVINAGKMYQDDGYKGIGDYAVAEYGINPDRCSWLMKVAEKFCEKDSPELLSEYKDFSISKLREMVYLDDVQLQEVKPETPVKEIRQMKPKPEIKQKQGIDWFVQQWAVTYPKDLKEFMRICQEYDNNTDRAKAIQKFKAPNGYSGHAGDGVDYTFKGYSLGIDIKIGDNRIHLKYNEFILILMSLYDPKDFLELKQPELSCDVATQNVSETDEIVIDSSETVIDSSETVIKATEIVIESTDSGCPPNIHNMQSCRRQEWGTSKAEQEAGKKECGMCWTEYKKRQKVLGTVKEEPVKDIINDDVYTCDVAGEEPDGFIDNFRGEFEDPNKINKRRAIDVIARLLLNSNLDWFVEDYTNRVLHVDRSEKQIKDKFLNEKYKIDDEMYKEIFLDQNLILLFTEQGSVHKADWFYLCASIQSLYNTIAYERQESEKTESELATSQVDEDITDTEYKEPKSEDETELNEKYLARDILCKNEDYLKEVLKAFADCSGDMNVKKIIQKTRIEIKALKLYLTSLESIEQELEEKILKRPNLKGLMDDPYCPDCGADLTYRCDCFECGCKIDWQLVRGLFEYEEEQLAKKRAEQNVIKINMEEKIQPELPVMKNNDQRKEFLETYETWLVWIDNKETEERYYRYDLPDGYSIVIKVYYSTVHYTGEELWRSKETYLIKQDMHFKDGETNTTVVIEHLKDMQKKVKPI